MNKGVDDVMVAYPLFQTDRGGSIPTSTHDLWIEEIPKDIFVRLNKKWHSRLPSVGGFVVGSFYGAMHKGIIYAVAWWSTPVTRGNNNKGMWELRRMAISDESPKNTASFMLGKMRRIIKKTMPEIKILISYQDTEVHKGTIYAASGWKVKGKSTVGNQGWNTRQGRSNQSTSDKVRWEYEM